MTRERKQIKAHRSKFKDLGAFKRKEPNVTGYSRIGGVEDVKVGARMSIHGDGIPRVGDQFITIL